MSYLAEIQQRNRQSEDLRVQPLLDKLAVQIAEVAALEKRERLYRVAIVALVVALALAVMS